MVKGSKCPHTKITPPQKPYSDVGEWRGQNGKKHFSRVCQTALSSTSQKKNHSYENKTTYKELQHIE